MEIPGRAAFLRAPGSANDHDLGLFEVPDGMLRAGPYLGLYHLAWEVGTLAELAEIRERLAASERAGRARATTGYPSRCTRRTRAGSSSRSCGGCPPRTGSTRCAAAR